MNNKLLSVVLVAWIAATWFAGISSADESSTGSVTSTKHERIELTVEQQAEREAMKALKEKVKAGTELTDAEQAQVDEFKANFSWKKGGKEGKMWGKRGWGKGGNKGMKNLTDEEKTALEAMSDEDKKVFFETKKEERKVEMEAKKAVMDKILAWTTLSSTEEATRLEIVAKMNEKEANTEGKKRGWNNESVGIMKKLVNLEELTAEEKTTLTEMKAKKEEREAAKEAISPILEKKKAGTELTEDEEAQLEAFKAENKSGKKGHWKRGWDKGEKRGDKNTVETTQD